MLPGILGGRSGGGEFLEAYRLELAEQQADRAPNELMSGARHTLCMMHYLIWIGQYAASFASVDTGPARLSIGS